jgi:hypothetical protein
MRPLIETVLTYSRLGGCGIVPVASSHSSQWIMLRSYICDTNALRRAVDELKGCLRVH